MSPSTTIPVKTQLPDGTVQWHVEGKLHREDGPARVLPDGTQEWRQHGQLHRVGAPAVVSVSGFVGWYRKGKEHREDGPALVYPDGTQEWYRNGKLHRDGAPARIESQGYEQWYQRGQCHREDGPASYQRLPSGQLNDDVQWWYKDVLYTEHTHPTYAQHRARQEQEALDAALVQRGALKPKKSKRL